MLKSVNLSLRHGNSPESAFAYAAYGMLLCGELDEPAVGFQYGKVGLAINERLDDVALRRGWSTSTPCLYTTGATTGRA
ncbi:hypothetical protein [Candidatus Reidiella endopervernicosa]|uniref:Uncharacterized protein n=1 Tax=Candidatus Reidiella endopervernicosa TaxID=2738883 RepID=A0A6N0HTX7_9GAMM|nr:hypothetical protein [Candidatus Reidiella endopervernicosa]QKQ25637.1 hypothetical protein HUE57_04515 [Candidatus Reidiella endopervernicosa]